MKSMKNCSCGVCQTILQLLSNANSFNKLWTKSEGKLPALKWRFISKHLISDCQSLRTSKTEKNIKDLLKLHPFAPKPPSRVCDLLKKINRRAFHKLADTVEVVIA